MLLYAAYENLWFVGDVPIGSYVLGGGTGEMSL